MNNWDGMDWREVRHADCASSVRIRRRSKEVEERDE